MGRKYEAVIGLEVHAELATRAKIFCQCSTRFGAEPNTQTCPVCLGLPGVLPVLNGKVLHYALRTALALNCEVSAISKFDRKNYYYPDLPKNYQISQNDAPFARGGWLEISSDGKKKRISIDNVHIEEDAGKNLHAEDTGLRGVSLVDFNRAGIPLLEIVTRPDMRSLAEVDAFMEGLRETLLYIGVSDCRMEEGSLRFEANISLRPEGEEKLRARVEMKNLNSFRAVLKALDWEIKRQEGVLARGEQVRQETRLWNDKERRTEVMRGKEEAQDYRYFPEPDLVPIVVSAEMIEGAGEHLPELPQSRRQRFVSEHGIPEHDAEVLTVTRELADYYEAVLKLFADAKTVSNWIRGEILRRLRERGEEISQCRVSPQALSELLSLVKVGEVSGKMAKDLLFEMFDSGKGARELVRKKGIAQISDGEMLRQAVGEAIEKNPEAVNEYRGGKQQVIGFLLGQVMKASGGRANPQAAKKMLEEELKT